MRTPSRPPRIAAIAALAGLALMPLASADASAKPSGHARTATAAAPPPRTCPPRLLKHPCRKARAHRRLLQTHV